MDSPSTSLGGEMNAKLMTLMQKIMMAIAVIVTAMLCATTAHADGNLTAYEQWVGDTYWAATCVVLGEQLTGNTVHDTGTALGVAHEISVLDGLTMSDAIDVVNYQVYYYCPQYWSYLVAIGDAAGTPTTPLLHAT